MAFRSIIVFVSIWSDLVVLFDALPPLFIRIFHPTTFVCSRGGRCAKNRTQTSIAQRYLPAISSWPFRGSFPYRTPLSSGTVTRFSRTVSRLGGASLCRNERGYYSRLESRVKLVVGRCIRTAKCSLPHLRPPATPARAR